MLSYSLSGCAFVRWLPPLVRAALGEERIVQMRATALNLFSVVMCEHTQRYRDALLIFDGAFVPPSAVGM